MRLEVDIAKTVASGGRSFTLAIGFASDTQRTVLYGPSGAGKSLALRAIGGLLSPDRGRIAFGGAAWFDAGRGVDVPPRDRRIGFLFQDYALFPHLTVRQNVGFGLRRGVLNPRRAARDPAGEHWLAALDLEEVADQWPAELSGGQRQRTALARALAGDPALLLLDEPFSALDADLRERARAEIDRLLDRLRVPLVMITHDPEDLGRFGESVVRLRDGRVEG